MTTTAIILSIALAAALATVFALLHRNSGKAAEAAALKERLASQQSLLQSADETIARLKESGVAADSENRELHEQTARLQAQNQFLQTQLDEQRIQHENNLKQYHEQMQQVTRQTEANFKVMAGEILSAQSNTLREQNEQRITEILSPLKEDIDKFRNQVNECYQTEARERFSLQQRIKELVETNNSIGREARELSAALRGNSKKQGDWGELILENILENSGLRKGEEYTIQEQTDSVTNQTHRDENGRALRPDVIIRCPDERVMIIDSKVSLTAFIDYVNAEDPELQQSHGQRHLQSVVRHINELAEKKYQDYIGNKRLDFVLMFIPNEGAYSAALTLDPSIWQKAYDKRVLIVSPTQLVGTLRLINQLWSHDRQTRNAIEIAEKSGQMYDKFVGLITDMEKIEKTLTTTQTALSAAMNKLRDGRGNLISRAENLRQLGIKTAKRLRVDNTSDSEDEMP